MPVYKRSGPSGSSDTTASPARQKRAKGSLNNFSCDSCKKSKIKCEPVANKEQCVACAKRGPTKVCVRNGIDNRSIATVSRQMEALKIAHQEAYTDIMSCIWYAIQDSNEWISNLKTMLKVASATACLDALKLDRLQNISYPRRSLSIIDDSRIHIIRHEKEQFSRWAFDHICKLQAILDTFVHSTPAGNQYPDLTGVFKTAFSYAGYGDLVDEFELYYPSFAFDMARYHNSGVLAEYKKKLVEDGLTLNLAPVVSSVSRNSAAASSEQCQFASQPNLAMPGSQPNFTMPVGGGEFSPFQGYEEPPAPSGLRSPQNDTFFGYNAALDPYGL